MRASWMRVRICLSLSLLIAARRLRRSSTGILSRQPEIDQIRDASWEPQQRLALYVNFARARLVALEQMRNDPKDEEPRAANP